MQEEKLRRAVRFGDFELDVESGELYQDGRKVQLQDQSLRILRLLLEKPGEPVSREEIRSRLWPNGTVVEFVNAVNATVKKLRGVLGDSADEPRYIETLKGHGYRLIMPVRRPGTSGCGSSIPADMNEPHVNGRPVSSGLHAVGKRISHYRILDQIGAGGMGVVYRAEDTRLGREVALKFISEELSSHPAGLDRLHLEARSASALNHPNICTIYDIGEEAGQPFIAMELLEGSTLRDRISSSSLSVSEVLEYAVQISDGLHAAHSKGIVHRDIKPGNIFITKQGLVKILDFGLAKMTPADTEELAAAAGANGSRTGPGPMAGTVAYMSPEQVQGKRLDSRSDLFSFGVVLYEMVTGHTPFHGDTDAEVTEAILKRAPLAPMRTRPKLPGRLNRTIARCLEKDRNRRYAKASEIHADLRRLEHDIRAGAKRRTLMSVGAATVLVASAAAYFFVPHTPKLTDRDSIVIADFVNKTGDSVFDGTLREGLAVQLRQSPFLSVVPEDRIQNTLRLMNRSADAPLTPQLARQVCERIGSAAVLQGSIARLGTQYVLGLRASSCSTGAEIDNQQVQALTEEEVLASLSKIATKFRSRAGESLAIVRKHDIPLQEATTPSLEALKAFNSARQMTFSAGSIAAAPVLKRAIEIDPQFAMAYATLGLTYSAMGESDLAGESTAKAYQLRGHASERERFFISVNYDRTVTRNLERAQQTCELWEHMYPRDPDAPTLASGFISQGIGNYERSIDEARKAIGLDPDHTFAWVNLAASYFFLNRLEEAKQVCARFRERKIIFPEIVLIRYSIAFLERDSATMEQQATLAKGKPGAEDWLAHSEALVLARSGRTELAKAMSRRAIDVAQQSGQRERAASYEAATALWEASFGDAAGAQRNAFSALELSKGRDVEYASALALALSGESGRARALTNDLEKRFTEDTSVKFTYVPTLRAALALRRGAPTTAIEALRATTPYELGMSGISFFGFFGGLYPAYLRGESYLALHRGREAEIEFQKIVDHPSLVIADPIGALVHLQLGRAYALSGDRSKARTAYEEFFTIWKDADPDVPISKEARVEYAKLR